MFNINQQLLCRFAKALMLTPVLCLAYFLGYAQTPAKAPLINIIFTSDAHYGITRAKFRGDTAVPGFKVNKAMIAEMNQLPTQALPQDGGNGAGKKIGVIDYLIQTGDIANRQEVPLQSATISWKQFEIDYMHNRKLTGSNGKPAQLLLVPGNHDISNAIGYYRPMIPLTDPTSMVQIYNLEMHPAKPLTNQKFNYADDKVNYSRDIKGIHFIFITLWPDSAERIWMEKDLQKVAKTTPVVIFTHDQPTCEAKHFTNPVPPHNMTPQNKFENLVPEYYKEGAAATKDDGGTDIEQRGFVKFLKLHPNIKAYFHGNSNWNEFYTYTGPDNDVNIKVFRVDSPMKGKYSSKDEKLLSFQLLTLDPTAQTITVRECLWNTQPQNGNQPVVFGKTETISLKVN